MDVKKKTASQSEDDERLHSQFTAYLITALRRSKSKYLMKKYRDRKMVTSLDQLLERQTQMPGQMEESALAAYSSELESIFDEGALEDVICNDHLLIAVLKLSDRERKILNLHLIHKMKHAEIATILGLRKNTVEQCYARTIRKLKAYMEGGGDDERI